MSVPYDETVLTANVSGSSASPEPPAAVRPGRPVLRATLGAACISSSAILVTLAHTGAATAAFYRCLLALPVLIPLVYVLMRKLRMSEAQL